MLWVTYHACTSFSPEVREQKVNQENASCIFLWCVCVCVWAIGNWKTAARHTCDCVASNLGLMRFVDVFWYARIAVRLSGTVKLGCRWQPCSTVYHVKWFPTTKSKGITYKQKETNKSYCFDSFCFLEITSCCNREKCWILYVSARFYFRLQSRQQEELRVSVFWSLKIHVCARKVSCLMFTTFDWRSNSSFSFCASLLFALRSEWKELMEHTLPFSLQPFPSAFLIYDSGTFPCC